MSEIDTVITSLAALLTERDETTDAQRLAEIEQEIDFYVRRKSELEAEATPPLSPETDR